MASNTMQVERSKVSLWIQAIRPFAYSASVIPVLIGAMGGLVFFNGTIDWYLLPIILVAAVLFHTGGNLVSEYFDYKKGVDTVDTFGSSRILVENLLTDRAVLFGGILTFIVGFALGLILVYVRGLDILYLGLMGLVAGAFYTVKPFQFKYIALGDLLIFFAFGPLLVLGSYFGLTGEMNWKIVWASIPSSLLIVAIVHANNTRDIKHDNAAKIKTLAGLIGIKGAKAEYYFLVTGAYIVTAALVAFGILDWYMAVVFVTLPGAIKNIKMFSKATLDNPEEIAMMDVLTAQHHMQFGLLFVIGMLLTALL